jgi:hypothetical protein
VKYVVELARALACHPAVFRVDLLTRLIEDPKVDKSYSVPEECLVPAGSDGGLGGAYIVRLPCGPRHEYIRCVLLLLPDCSKGNAPRFCSSGFARGSPLGVRLGGLGLRFGGPERVVDRATTGNWWRC